MMKVDAAGQKQWTKTFGNYPGGINQFSNTVPKNYNIDECWGISKTVDANGMHDGFAIACGTGIENCSD